MSQSRGELCSDEALQNIVAAADDDAQRALANIAEALADFPGDPRLYFLKGSLLIGLGHFIEAHQALARAVAIAPDYAIARFQLGFFELTSGEAEASLVSWAPLKDLPDGHWLRSFVSGLEHLIADRFAACIDALRAGVAANDENAPLNRDMELIITECSALLASRKAPAKDEEVSPTEVSSASFLLGLHRG